MPVASAWTGSKHSTPNPALTLPGWRKAKAWRSRLKSLQRRTSQIVHRGGGPAAAVDARVRAAVREYLAAGHGLATKVSTSLLALRDQPVRLPRGEALQYFHAMLLKHLELVDRRLLRHETIPAADRLIHRYGPNSLASLSFDKVSPAPPTANS